MVEQLGRKTLKGMGERVRVREGVTLSIYSTHTREPLRHKYLLACRFVDTFPLRATEETLSLLMERVTALLWIFTVTGLLQDTRT